MAALSPDLEIGRASGKHQSRQAIPDATASDRQGGAHDEDLERLQRPLVPNSGGDWNPAGDPVSTDNVVVGGGTSLTVSGEVRVRESDIPTRHGTTPSASANAPYSEAVATVSDTGYAISSRSVA